MMSGESAPIISVCIANYNGEEIIADCIESVLRQEGAPAFEILVHDDASTDKSLAVLEKYGSVRLIRSSENVGFCISNNRMAAAARGQFVLLLNNDAQLYPDALSTLYEESRKREGNVLLGLPQYDFDTGKLVDRGLKLDYFASSVPIMSPSGREVAMVIGACLWVPADLWRAIGGFPEWFETNAEDVYLCCYARVLGYKIHVCERSGFLHMIGHTLGGGKSDQRQLQISTRRRYFSERNRLFVTWLFYPAWLLPLTTALNWIVLAGEALALSIANRRPALIWDIYIKSQRDAFANMDTVREARRAAMRSRVISSSEFFRPFTLVPQKLRLLLTFGLPRT